MTSQITEQFESFSEAELETLEFFPEELEEMESKLYPNLESISIETVAKDLEVYFEGNKFSRPSSPSRGPRRLPPEIWLQIMQHMTWERYQALRRVMHLPDPSPQLRRRMMANSMAASVAASRKRRG